MPRRMIRIGATVVSARVCEICPQHPAIFPTAAYDAHVANHAHPVDPRAKVGLKPLQTHRGGRTIGSHNHQYISVIRTDSD